MDEFKIIDQVSVGLSTCGSRISASTFPFVSCILRYKVHHSIDNPFLVRSRKTCATFRRTSTESYENRNGNLGLIYRLTHLEGT